MNFQIVNSPKEVKIISTWVDEDNDYQENVMVFDRKLDKETLKLTMERVLNTTLQ